MSPDPSSTQAPKPTSTPTDAHAGSPVPGIVTPTTVPLPSSVRISTPSNDVLWITVGAAVLFRSSDRGETWQQRGLPPSGLRLEGTTFVSDREGWVAYYGAVAGGPCRIQPVLLWHTSDAGATYEALPANGVPDEGCKGNVSFLDARRGFISVWHSGAPALLYHTSDGGRNWTASDPLPPPPNAGGATLEIGAVEAFGSTLLVDVLVTGVADPGHVVYRSTNGGTTWTLASPRAIDGRVAFLTATRWISLMSPDRSLETTDAGTTWTPFATDYQQAAPIDPVIVFAGPSVGYATVRGGIQRTLDGGAHWTPIRTPGT